MGTSLAAFAQFINCVLDCRDMQDLFHRRRVAMQNFVEMRSEGKACLGPFNGREDRSFPIYAPLLFTSFDRLMCGDLGLVPAFFGQMPEEAGTSVGMNSYSYSSTLGYRLRPIFGSCAGSTITQNSRCLGTAESLKT